MNEPREGSVAPGRRRRLSLGSELLRTDPSTQPIPLVARLKGTPFEHVPTRTSVPDDILEAIDLVLRIAALSIRTGAGMRDVETTVLAAAASLGLADEHLEIDLTFTSAIVSYAPPAADPVVRVRVVRAPGRDYSRMTMLHQLVLEMVAKPMDRAEVDRRLRVVEHARRPYNRLVVRLSYGLMTALLVLRLEDRVDWIPVATSFFATLVVDRVGEFLLARGLPYVITAFCGAAIATTIALVVGHVAAQGVAATDPLAAQRTSLVIAGGLVMLLPGLLIVSVVEDGLWDYPLTASARLFQVMMQVAAILAGIAIPYAVAPSIGAQVPQMRDPLAASLRTWWWMYPVLTFAATVFTAVGTRVPRRLLVVAGVLGALGNVAQLAATALHLPTALGVLFAALLVGALGRVIAVRRDAPPVALTVAGITPLLPGLSTVEAIRVMTHGVANEGMLRLLSAGTTACAIGAGVVLGSLAVVNVHNGMETVAARSGSWVGNRFRRRPTAADGCRPNAPSIAGGPAPG